MNEENNTTTTNEVANEVVTSTEQGANVMSAPQGEVATQPQEVVADTPAVESLPEDTTPVETPATEETPVTEETPADESTEEIPATEETPVTEEVIADLPPVDEVTAR